MSAVRLSCDTTPSRFRLSLMEGGTTLTADLDRRQAGDLRSMLDEWLPKPAIDIEEAV